MNLEAAAERFGERPALAFRGERITYRELDALAQRAGSPDVDVFVMPNTPESVARYHGTVQKGGVVVPLNPALSPRELEQRRRPFTPGAGTTVALFTSGTTGEPKRIELSRARLERNAAAVVDALGVGEADVVFGAAPLSHVFGMTGCMNAAIHAGACVALVERFDADAALEIVEREGVSVFIGVPAMLAALLRASDESGRAPAIRVAHVGGAPLPLGLAQEFERRFGAIVLEGYGMTEVGGAVAVSRHDRPRKSGSVGQAVAGQRIEVAADGELLVDGLATGDIGRVDDDGYVFLLDRKKHVILRGGYTVYPREVEDVLCSHPGVDEAAVVGVPDETVGEEVVAFVVGSADPDGVRAYAREQLAGYKYPRLVMVLDSLPRGATGKPDRAALARLADARPPRPA
jgi:long-chain acyl-CoA synthetase